jgi:hypothetical protein
MGLLSVLFLAAVKQLPLPSQAPLPKIQPEPSVNEVQVLNFGPVTFTYTQIFYMPFQKQKPECFPKTPAYGNYLNPDNVISGLKPSLLLPQPTANLAP